MAGLHLVAAWLVVQVADTLLPVFGAPDWVMKAIVMVLVIGFLPALVVSWLYELTPAGFQREDELASGQASYQGADRRLRRISDGTPAQPGEPVPSPEGARRLGRLIIVFLVLALGYFLVEKVVTTASQADSAAAAAVTNKSIAVLAFADLSPDGKNKYFADGIAEEILNALAKVDDLKVAGRTSSFYF